MLTTLPNLLTLARIVAIPAVVALLSFDSEAARWVAFVLFGAAAFTDWLDGRLARARGEVSPLGRFLDPIADKLLVAAVVVMLVASGDVAGWAVVAAIVILCREILVSGLREYLAELSVPMPVSKLAKWKTAVQLAAISLLILAPVLTPELGLAAEALLWLAAGLTLITGWDYLVRGLTHMRAGSGGE
ncbi:CDP-diacylglycerol--glycerol-3-phosphate 3-phosphatidyltransferase [Algihabitans albus]|uniref:CDP-diacylglycerol--glycerol-3-phosphate 3-phosphatidyltransferase n=1 Tax=Algihabitans albus TaxID=2164067 RepID=UPI000E5CC769|nr:CDP-diacylglycerol--glycerol-3-phosphate 3-phosphatidyltransferase [Algihabitans albus]